MAYLRFWASLSSTTYKLSTTRAMSAILYVVSSCLLLHVTCAISSQSSLLDPVDHLHRSLSSNHQLTPVSRSQTVLFGMLHLTCGTRFLLLFVILIITQLCSIVRLWSWTGCWHFLWSSPRSPLNFRFCQSLSLHSHLLFARPLGV